MKSIMQDKDGRCYLCGKLGIYNGLWKDLEEHHVFFGTAGRAQSEKYGLKVYLCREHHKDGPNAVHRNAEMAEILRQDGQRAFERARSREDFMRIFGKNHLFDDESLDPMEAGMRDAAENGGFREQAAGIPPGVRVLEEAGAGRTMDLFFRIRKADAAALLSDRQFKNLLEIIETLGRASAAERR